MPMMAALVQQGWEDGKMALRRGTSVNFSLMWSWCPASELRRAVSIVQYGL
jgi:hypothetical protein